MTGFPHINTKLFKSHWVFERKLRGIHWLSSKTKLSAPRPQRRIKKASIVLKNCKLFNGKTKVHQQRLKTDSGIGFVVWKFMRNLCFMTT